MVVVSESREEHRLILLGYLLQTFGAVFGVTLIIGALINHIRCPHLRDPLYRAHCRWQIVTFWLTLVATAIALLSATSLPLWVGLLWLAYRVARGWHALTRGAQPPHW